MLVECVECKVKFDKKIAEVNRTNFNACSKKCTGDYKSRVNDAKFLSKAKRVESGCLEWQGSTNSSGYGTTRFNKRPQLAHRVSFEIYTGKECDLQVLHRCDNPKCIDPEHLFEGTHQDNMADMISKGRKSTKLTRAQVDEIRDINGMRSEDIAVRFGVCRRTISGILSNETWKMEEA